ncbi:ATP-binding protein [Rhodoferax sp.]|uniref:ATP-binding protein n=1 Tax=Rhodoferax sp. TaxID=50421 RepID=UPI003425568F
MPRLPALKSLQARLLALLLLMVALVWLTTAIFTWLDIQHELDELLDGHLAQSAALLVAQQTGHGADGTPPPELGNDDHHDDDDAPPLHKYAPRVAFQVFHEGHMTLRSANAPATPMTQVSRGFDTVELADQTRWRVFAARGNEGDVQVYIGEQVSSRSAILWAILQGVLMPLVYALPLLGLVGWLAVRHGLTPLRRLSRELSLRQPQALDAVKVGDMPSEIEPVVQALNALLERIHKMLANERRFTADAAHELRTPIAAIRMQAQVALGAGTDAQQRTHALEQTLEGCDRATHLVEQLLTLSRLEAASAAPPTHVIDLAVLAQRVAADMAPDALCRKQDLALDASGSCLIQADEILTSVLLRNLVDNALRYSPHGAEVLISISRSDLVVTLQVQDSGCGLADSDITRLGERFFRVLGNNQAGSGLGWSIVRRIAAVYQAEVDVQRSAALGGLCVTVRWPR